MQEVWSRTPAFPYRWAGQMLCPDTCMSPAALGVIPRAGTVLHMLGSPGALVTAHTNSVAQGSGQEVV